MSGQASYQGKWAFMAAGGTFNGSTPTWDFISDTVQKTETILVGQGIRGYRQKQIDQERQGLYDVAGTLTCNPSIGWLSYFLPFVMGGGTATVPAFAAAVPAFDMVVSRGDGIYKYAGMKATKLTLKLASGQIATCAIDVIGKTEATTTFSGAALGTGILYEPLQAADCVFTADGDAQVMEDLELSIDNGLVPKRRMKLTVQDIMEGDREVALRGTSVMDSTSLASLYGLTSPDVSTSISLTNTLGASSVSATFTFSRVRFPSRTGTAQADEFLLPIEALCRGASAGVEFTALLDITP